MRTPIVTLALFALASTGCDDSQPFDVGTSQAIQVRNRTTQRAATFHGDALPDVFIEDGGEPSNLAVTKIETISGNALLGQQGKVFLGRASPDAYAIGVGIPALFQGYWTTSLGAPDPSANNELNYDLLVDFGRSIPPGNYEIVFVAFDAAGNAGPRSSVPICIVPDIADNLNSCFPTRAPADTIITLDWDTNADLDLVVVTPSGKVVTNKRPTTGTSEGGSVPQEDLDDPSTGRFTRDSNAACNIDGARLESLVFKGEPAEGQYTIYVSYYNSCGQSNVRFHTRLFRSYMNEDGTYRTEREDLATGQLFALQANRGETNGTLAATITLP